MQASDVKAMDRLCTTCATDTLTLPLLRGRGSALEFTDVSNIQSVRAHTVWPNLKLPDRKITAKVALSMIKLSVVIPVFAGRKVLKDVGSMERQSDKLLERDNTVTASR
jgi:hypothetical protein